MMILTLLNLCTLKVVHDFNCLAIPIHYVPAPLELLPITALSESIGYNFSLAWTFCAHATITQSSQGDIFFMSAKDLMGIGTQEEIC